MAASLQPDDAYREAAPRLAAADQDDRRRLHRPQGQGRLLSPATPTGGKRVKESIDLKTGDYAPPTTRALESADAAKGGPQASWSRTRTRAANTPGRVLSKTADLCRVPGAGDRRRRRRCRSGDEDRLQLEARPVRDDRPAGRRLVRRAACAAEKMRRAAAAGARGEDRRLLQDRWTAGCNYLGTDGAYHAGRARPKACCCSPTSSATASRSCKNGSAVALGHRRRRRLPRIPQQDERARSRYRSAW